MPESRAILADNNMAKFKAAKGKRKSSAKSNWSALPCAIIVISVIALVTLLFFYGLKG